MRYFSYPSRTLCEVLDDMRKCDKTKNYASLEGLIEEVQVLANRMESGLDQQRDYEFYRKKLKKLRKKVQKIEENDE